MNLSDLSLKTFAPLQASNFSSDVSQIILSLKQWNILINIKRNEIILHLSPNTCKYIYIIYIFCKFFQISQISISVMEIRVSMKYTNKCTQKYYFLILSAILQ